MEYKNINENNEQFASFISCFGYGQNAFETMQNIYDKAKLQKSVLKIDKKPSNLAINFRLLAKDDPLGFVLGDITNCCQKIGDNAESCIEDGYLSEFAGFVVFENNSISKKSNNLANILGQSYVWYDPKTKTVCLDNIEIPRKVKESIEDSKSFNAFDFVESIEKCAESLASAMNENGTEVLKVTIGDKHNDLKKFLEPKFELESPPKALNNRYVFSDAERGQFVLFKQNSPSKNKNTFNLEN